MSEKDEYKYCIIYLDNNEVKRYYVDNEEQAKAWAGNFNMGYYHRERITNNDWGKR